jgi:hypothetical protein
MKIKIISFFSDDSLIRYRTHSNAWGNFGAHLQSKTLKGEKERDYHQTPVSWQDSICVLKF